MLGIGYLFRKLFGLVTRPASEVTAHNPIAPFVPPSDEAWRHLSKRDALAVWGLQQYADDLIELAEPAVRLEIAPIDQANHAWVVCLIYHRRILGQSGAASPWASSRRFA